MKRVRSATLAFSTALTLAACGQQPAPEPSPRSVTAHPTIQAQASTLAHIKVTLAPDHTLEFIELEPGDISIHESGHMDRTKPVLSQDLVRSHSVLELFQRFAPQNTEVPQELVDAVARQGEAAASRTVPPRDLEAAPSGALPSKPLPGTSSNWNLDYQWFYDLTCPTHITEFCMGNVSSAWTKKDKTVLFAYFEVTGMNASEHPDARARLLVDRTKLVYPGGFVWRSHWWKDNILPRWYHKAYFTTHRSYFGKVEASGPEARAHFASGYIPLNMLPF